MIAIRALSKKYSGLLSSRTSRSISQFSVRKSCSRNWTNFPLELIVNSFIFFFTFLGVRSRYRILLPLSNERSNVGNVRRIAKCPPLISPRWRGAKQRARLKGVDTELRGTDTQALPPVLLAVGWRAVSRPEPPCACWVSVAGWPFFFSSAPFFLCFSNCQIIFFYFLLFIHKKSCSYG